MIVVALSGLTDEANLVRHAQIAQPSDSRGGPAPVDGAGTRLADTTSDAGLAWDDGIDGYPAILEIDLGRAARLAVVVCRWRFAPSDYSVEVHVDTGWRQVASVKGNTIATDKIFLHTFAPVTARRVRLVVTGTVSQKRLCGWRALEIYADGQLSRNVQQFLDRATPCQYYRPSDPTARKQNAQQPLKRDLLDAPIPTWKPIPHRLYNGKPEGKRVNELASERSALLSSCADAYLQTGRREYAAKARDVLFTVIDHYDRYQAFRFVGRSWQAVTFQEPGYMLTGLLKAYDAVADALTPAERLRFLYFGLDLGDFQDRAIQEITPLPEHVNRRGQICNWVPNSFGALALAAVYLRDFPETQTWLATCDRRFPGFLKDVFFLGDGTWWECSPAHHGYVLRGVYKYALAKHLLGEPIWNRKFGEISVADTFEALAKTANPLGEYPSVNDSYGHGKPIGRSYSEFVKAATMMGRGDFLHAWRARPTWPAAAGIKPRKIDLRPPSYTSVLMPNAGHAVFRDGWAPDDAYLFFDYGPHGGGHGHLDKLAFALCADGHHWMPDAACAPHYCIFPEQWNWHKQTISHNTVLVDGKSQARCTGKLVHWHTDAEADLVSAEHRDGYVSRAPLTLDLDGKTHRLTLTPRESVPLRLAAVRLKPVAGEAVVLAWSAFKAQGGRVGDDVNAPEKHAAEITAKNGRIDVKLSGLTGGFRVSVLGRGADMSHDSVYIALDGKRVGQSALGVRKYQWQDAIGLASGLHHRRTCYHPRGSYFLFHDTLIATDGQAHTLDWLGHVYGKLEGQRPGSLCFKHGERRLLIASPDVGQTPVKIEQGLCGGLERHKWKGKGYPPKGGPGWIYIPYFRLQKRLTADAAEAHFWVLVLPFRGRRPDVALDLLPAGASPSPERSGARRVQIRMDNQTDEFAETFDPPTFVVTSRRPDKPPAIYRYEARRKASTSR